MGLKLRRVPLDFSHPIGEVWPGYLSPTWRPCPNAGVDCFDGSTAAGMWLDSVARLIALIGDEGAVCERADESRLRGGNYPHPYLLTWEQRPRNHERGGTVPLTRQLRVLVEGLAGERWRGGVCGFTPYKIASRLAKLAGMQGGWDHCPVCSGHGIHPDDVGPSKEWQPTHPPTGPGFQLWETTTEGSPVSPVFSTLDALCAWCADGATTFGSATATAEEWRQMLDANFVHHTEGSLTFL